MTPAPKPLGRRGRWTLAGAGMGLTLLLFAANAHLVAVSLASDPGCVPHLKAPGAEEGAFRAAKPAC
jgi:hypothetical protein